MLARIVDCSGVVGFNVARRRVLCVKKFAQHGLIVGVGVKKFALRARNTPNLTFLRLLGELFCGNAGGGTVLGELCHGLSGGEGVPGEFCRACRPTTATGPGSATVPVPVIAATPVPATACRPATILCGASGDLHIGDGGDLAALGAGCWRVGGVSGF